MKITRLNKILLCFLIIFLNSCNNKNAKKVVTQTNINDVKLRDKKVDFNKENKNFGFLVMWNLDSIILIAY